MVLVTALLAVTGCGGSDPSPEARTPTSAGRSGSGSGLHFETPAAIADMLRKRGFELHNCDAQAEPTVISERAIQCFHTAPDGATDALAFDIYSSDQQEVEAHEYLSGLGSWAETIYGDRWSVSSGSRQTAKQVRAILQPGGSP